MLTLTEQAIQAVEAVLESATGVADSPGLRISMAPADDHDVPVLTLEIAEAPLQSDSVLEEGPARLFLDTRAVEFLDDKLLDASFDEDRVHFTVEALPGSMPG